MFGSVFTMRSKPGQEQALVALFDRWNQERRPKIKGSVGGFVFRSADDPRQFIAVAVFDSRESYFANANDPEQDRWYRELVAVLEGEPKFSDGDVLSRF